MADDRAAIKETLETRGYSFGQDSRAVGQRQQATT